jgi:hypothetical protein
MKTIRISLDFIFSKFDATYKKENYLFLLKGLFNFISLVIAIIIIISLTESLFYLGKPIRAFLFFGSLICICALLLYLAVKPALYYFEIIKKRDYENLALRLGNVLPNIKDHILNVLQIVEQNDTKYNYSESLVEESVRAIRSKVNSINFDIILDKKSLIKPRNYAITFILLFGILLIFNGSVIFNSLNRIVLFAKDFTPPSPFTITLLPGNTEITKGDSVRIHVKVDGEKQNHIYLSYKHPEQNKYESLTLNLIDGQQSYLFENLKNDLDYYAFLDEVTSEKHKIKVVDRPVVKTLRVHLTPPSYTGLEAKYLDNDIGDITAILGSRVRIEIDLNKEITEGKLIFSDTQSVTLKKNERNAYTDFSINKNKTYHIDLTDEKGSKNVDPIEYEIKTIIDEFPSITIAEPGKNSDINDDMRLSLHIKIKDDFGFSKCRIGYKIVKTRYSLPQEEFTFLNIPISSPLPKEQDIYYLWNLSPLSLAPDDIAAYYIEIYDNDNVSGPKLSKSNEYFVRFPSLDEILRKSEETQKVAFQDMQKIHEEAKELKKTLDDINQDLKKSKDIDWQQQKKMEDLAKKYDELQKKVEEVTKNIEESTMAMAENKIISPETMDKYMELQKLMSEITSPDFSQAMKKLQDAMRSMSPEDMRQAMQNMTFNEESFRSSIERTMNIMKRVMIEQKTDDVMKRIDRMIEQQSLLNEEASKTNSANKGKLEELAQKQDELKKELENAKDELDELLNRVQEFKDEMPFDQLQQIAQNMQQQNTGQMMQSSSQQMQQGNKQEAQKSQEQISEDLNFLKQQMQDFKKNLLEGQQKQVLNALRKALKEILEVSVAQENLKNQTMDYSQFSQRSRDLAQQQSGLQSDLTNVITQLYSLAQKSFAITPQMSKSIGDAFSKMSQSVGSLSNRSTQAATQQQTGAMSSLNQTAQELQNAIKNMGNQGQQGQGMPSLLQQLGQMANQQQGINQGMMPFGSGSGQLTPQQQAELSRLLGEQQAVQKSLEQLQEEAEKYGNQDRILGDLDKISKEMQEVIEEMKNKNVNENTIQKQERILSRLLDAQRSMRERDFEKQRKSNTGQDFTRESPKDIDFNLLNSKNNLQKDLLKAIESGFAKDYETIIRKYFESIEKSQEIRN